MPAALTPRALLPTPEALRTSLAEDDLETYVEQAWAVIEPKTPYLSNWHISLLCEYLTAVTVGQTRRLIVNIPPRYMKSILVSIMWPTWAWIKAPWLRWMFASYAFSLSVDHSKKRRTIIQSPWYQERWGSRYQLAADQNSKSEFENTARGAMLALSVGGGTGMGKGADIIVIDDPIDPLQAYSDAERTAANTYYDQTLSTRLNDKATGAIVIVMQRLHQQDLVGHVLDQEPWDVVKIPGEGKPTMVNGAALPTVMTFPLSGRTVTREVGDALWAAREPASMFPALKRRLGTQGYASQYQQEPSPEEGGIIKKAWLRWYTDLPLRFDHMLASWDLSFKATDDSSRVAGQVWGVVGARRYLLARVAQRLAFPATVRAIRQLHEQWPGAVPILIEDKANGPAVISTLEDEIPGIVAVNPQGDKIARCHAVAPYFEAGNVFYPVPAIAPWVEEYVAELTGFPTWATDDETDATTQALNHMKLFASVTEAMMRETTVTPSVAGGLWAPGVQQVDSDEGSGIAVTSGASNFTW